MSEPLLSEKLSPGRLRWACRRGMLELDILLGNFVAFGYDQLQANERIIFHQLLASQDQDLYEMCMGLKPVEGQEIKHVIEKIRNAATHTSDSLG